MTHADLPTIFVGSSAEAKPLTQELTRLLDESGVVTVLPWYNAFQVSYAAIEELARRLTEVDFAAFFLASDDQIQRREGAEAVPRDNVVFELGLFMGKLNRDRTFALVNEASPATLPSDFGGVTTLRFRQEKLDVAVATLIERVRKLGHVARVPNNAHIVEAGAEGKNVYDTIASAIEAAAPRDVVLVRPGIYTEALVIDKPLEIIGVGVLDDHQIASIRTTGCAAITYDSRAGAGRLSALAIEAGGDPDCAALDIIGGYLAIEACQLSSRGPAEAAIRVRGHGRARMVGNTIADGDSAGIVVCERGAATIRDNSIARNAHSGVEIRDGTKATVFGNRIYGGRSGGILVSGLGSCPVIERNDLYENRDASVAVADQADPEIKGNRIHHGHGAGVWVGDGGRSIISENDIYENNGTGIDIGGGGQPVIIYNRIYNGAGGGVVFHADAGGRLDHNDIRGNQRAGVAILSGARPVTFTYNAIVDGRAEGVYDEIQASWAENDVARNAGGDWCHPEDES